MGFCGRKTTYWILSPTSSSTCQWGSPLFSIQPYFHCLSSGLRSIPVDSLLHSSGVLPSFLSNHISIACRLDFVPFQSTLYYIPSSILTLPLNKMSHFGTFVTSLTVYWHH